MKNTKELFKAIETIAETLTTAGTVATKTAIECGEIGGSDFIVSEKSHRYNSAVVDVTVTAARMIYDITERRYKVYEELYEVYQEAREKADGIESRRPFREWIKAEYHAAVKKVDDCTETVKKSVYAAAAAVNPLDSEVSSMVQFQRLTYGVDDDLEKQFTDIFGYFYDCAKVGIRYKDPDFRMDWVKMVQFFGKEYAGTRADSEVKNSLYYTKCEDVFSCFSAYELTEYGEKQAELARHYADYLYNCTTKDLTEIFTEMRDFFPDLTQYDLLNCMLFYYHD